MGTTVFLGIFGIGFVFGYLLYYAVRHTAQFNIELLSSAIGAVGGGVVIGWLGHTSGWIGPYGIGLFSGFLFYLVLAFCILSKPNIANAVNGSRLMLSRTLLGKPQ